MVATIPATSDGQAADSSALIDAAGLELSDLGSSSGGAPDNPGQGGAFDRGGRDGPQERGERGGEAGSAPGNPAASAAGFDGGVIVASLLAESSMPAQSMPGAGAQAAMNPPTEAQNSTSANLPDQGETAEEDLLPASESEESVSAEAPASKTEGGGNDFTQEDGTPMPEGSSQTQQTEEPMQEDSSVTDEAQGQMTDPFGGTEDRNQAEQRQPAESQGTQPGSEPGENAAVQTDRETVVLLAASLVCLLVGLAAVFLYPRKH